MSLLDVALTLDRHACSVVPVTTDGRKVPAVSWKPYQSQRPGTKQLRTWFANGHYDGLGVICGSVSLNLEMFEVEGRATSLVTELATLMTDNGFGDLWARLCSGYLEQSPSGGLHWIYRVDGEARANTKLARRPATDEELVENPDEKVKVLIETRGEGGYTVVAPSAGRTHATGRAWTVLTGGPQTIPTITADERDALFAIATMLDQMPAPEPPKPSSGPDLLAGGTRPGDDYNARADWSDILTPHGWEHSKTFNRGYGWTRPGKSKREGISATTGTSSDGADRLYVFSTSTEFETETPYTKFAAYTLLEHNGDYSKAARALRADGYGTPPPEPPRPAEVTASERVANQEAEVDESVAATYSLTDDGNALRLVDTHGDTIRYCPQRGQWLTWDTYRWVWDEAGYVTELARGIARSLPEDHKAAAMHRKVSLSARGISAIPRLAQTDRRTVASVASLDARPYELNTPAGIVNLRTGKLHDPDPAALHTRSTAYAPDDDTPAPRWHKFLADTFAGDPALTTYVQRLLGQSLVGIVLEQLLPFAYGAGANGKTTLLSVVQRLIGIGDTGYAISAPADLLIATHQQGHPTEIARLSGARLVVTSELEDGQRFAEAKVKQLTGGDVISGRFMRQDWFSFTPTHTLWLLANHQPEVRAGGAAFWRRIAMLPFLHTVPTDQRDPHLEDRLVDDEGPAILSWLITGARDYLAHGLAAPDSVRAATTAYERDQDTVARFVEDRCQIAPPGTQGYAVRSSDLRSAYETWCRQEGETPVAPKTLTLTLRSRYDVMSVRSKNARLLDGIRLLDASPEDDHASPDGDDDGQEAWWKR